MGVIASRVKRQDAPPDDASDRFAFPDLSNSPLVSAKTRFLAGLTGNKFVTCDGEKMGQNRKIRLNA
jgi:hypothetical protein